VAPTPLPAREAVLPTVVVRGRVVRKKKRGDWLVASILAEDAEGGDGTPSHKSVPVWISRRNGDGIDAALSSSLFLDSVVATRAALIQQQQREDGPNCYYYVAVHVQLRRCAPNPTAVQMVLERVAASASRDDDDGRASDSECDGVVGTDISDDTSTALTGPVTFSRCHWRTCLGSPPFCTSAEQIRRLMLSKGISGDTGVIDIVDDHCRKNGGNKKARRLFVARLVRHLADPFSSVETPDPVLQKNMNSSDDDGRSSNDNNSNRRPLKHRPPHTKRRHVALLERVERDGRSRALASKEGTDGDSICIGWKLLTPTRVELTYPKADGGDDNDDDSGRGHCKASLLPLLLPLDSRLPQDEIRRRLGYLVTKKRPQVRWMVDRILKIVKNSPGASSNGCRRRCWKIVDVGGGRGDLAVALAARLLTEEANGGDCYSITVVDVNESSLEGGKMLATNVLGPDNVTTIDVDNVSQRGQRVRLEFVLSNFVDYAATTESEPNDAAGPTIVVALHACGVSTCRLVFRCVSCATITDLMQLFFWISQQLSDLALEFAQRNGGSFVICPCCYTKRFHQQHSKIQPLSASPMRPPNCLMSKNGDQGKYSPYVSEPPWWNQCRCYGNKSVQGDNERNTCQGEDPSAVLGRLAELNERPDVSRRARTAVNSIRLCTFLEANHCADSKRPVALSIEEFEGIYSKRNQVLVGVVTATS